VVVPPEMPRKTGQSPGQLPVLRMDGQMQPMPEGELLLMRITVLLHVLFHIVGYQGATPTAAAGTGVKGESEPSGAPSGRQVGRWQTATNRREDKTWKKATNPLGWRHLESGP